MQPTEKPFPNKKWDKQVWDQIKNIKKTEMIVFMAKDDRGVWKHLKTIGAVYVYHTNKYKPPFDMLTIHYHPGDTFTKGSLTDHLDHVCWTVDDLIRFKIIKKH